MGKQFSHVEQLYNYGSAVRKIMYTTNAIESVYARVTKKGAFPNEDAVFKIFYLRIQELYKKWKGRHVANWAMVRNQLPSWTTGCSSLCSNTMLLIESIYTKLLTHPYLVDTIRIDAANRTSCFSCHQSRTEYDL